MDEEHESFALLDGIQVESIEPRGLRVLGKRILVSGVAHEFSSWSNSHMNVHCPTGPIASVH